MDAKCTQCGETDLQIGFMADYGQASNGYQRWVEGELERGVFGGARLLGRAKWETDALRCPNCGHLELYALREA